MKLYFTKKRTNQFDYVGRPVQGNTESDGQPQASLEIFSWPRGRPDMTDLSTHLWEPS